MDSFRDTLADLGPAVIWLEQADAFTAFRRAWLCFDESRHGLSKVGFDHIERLDVDVPATEVGVWLEDRIGRGPEVVLVVYMQDEVCEVPAQLFVKHWRSHFCPPRDDIVVLPRYGGWVLGYFHEDQFEFARGGLAEPPDASAAADRDHDET